MKLRNDAHFLEALYVVFLALCLALLSSCSHDPAMDKRIAAETAGLPAMSASARAREAEKQIEAAPLSPDKKAQLERLSLAAASDLQALRDESSRLRLLLVRKLIDPASEEREIDAIKKRILETDQESSKRWLSALDDARGLLGRKNEQDQRFYRALLLRPAEIPGLPRDEGVRDR